MQKHECVANVQQKEKKIYEYFIEKGELFKLIMDSTIMLERGRRLAHGIARHLTMLGIDRGRILDVGCGTGRVSIPLAEMGFNVVGIDISSKYIEVASRRAKEKGLEDKTVFITCDAREMEKCVEEYKPFVAVIFVWSSVLGYYDEDADLKILSAAYNVTTNNAALIVADSVSRDLLILQQYLLGMGKRVFEYDNIVVMEKLLYNPVTGNALVKQEFFKKDQSGNLIFLDDAYFEMHVYSLDELSRLANKAGWCMYRVLSSLEKDTGFSPFSALNAIFVKCKK